MADDSKKDLTSLNDLSKSTASDDPFVSNEGSATPEPAFEGAFSSAQSEAAPIEVFESLEELSKTALPDEPPSSQSLMAPAVEFDDEPALAEPVIGAATETPEPSVLPEHPEHSEHPEHPELSEPKASIARIRSYAEQVTPNKGPVQAAYPFSVLINGFLEPYERAKLLDVLSRENFGIREVDLEPQFESGRVLIPRISEFAAVLLVQALRGTRAELKCGPSDSIFSTKDTQDLKSSAAITEKKIINKLLEGASHPAELIPVIADASVPGVGEYEIIDTLTASASLKTNVVEAETSPEYQEILEALQRKLKYMAYRKGAVAVVRFAVQLTPLFLPSRYKVLVMGEAVRPVEAGSFPEPRLDV
jgi:hypothetical protein